MDDIEVRPLVDLPSLHRVEELEQAIWGMTPRDVVPAHQLLAATTAGGLVLGALTPAGALVGFAYGFVGLREGAVLFYSLMAGVRSDFRGSHVGFRLKCAQREFVLAQGIDRMVWTFDPLVSANASFNLHKLGAVACRYYVNHYGEMADDLNRGIESDRLEVDWWLCAPRVEAALRGDAHGATWEDTVPVLDARPANTARAPGPVRFGVEAPLLRVEIPMAFDPLKAANPPLVQSWRLATREAFRHYLGRGYCVVDFLRAPSATDAVGAHVLSRQPEATRP